MCTCDRACFLLFLFFSLVRQFGVSECGLSRIFASRRSGSRRSVHGMADIMVGIYSSFSANCDGRRRPWSRECQLFFRVFCDGRVRGERDEQKKLTKTREERGPRGRRIFTLWEFRENICYKPISATRAEKMIHQERSEKNPASVHEMPGASTLVF